MRTVRMSVVVLASLALCQLSPAAEGEKLLLGFEEAELESIVARFNQPPKEKKERWRPPFYHQEMEDGEIHFLQERAAYGDWRILPMRSSDKRASQGARSLRVPLDIRKPILPRRPALSSQRAPILFGTFGMKDQFGFFFSRDWSGYPLLQVDVYLDWQPSPESRLNLLMEIEDRDIVYPVRRRYQVPSGKWVTLEMDLEKAVSVRGLDLKQVTGFWIRLDALQDTNIVRPKEPIQVYIDNLRLASPEVPATHKVLIDESPLQIKLPRAYAVLPEWELAGERWQGRWKEVDLSQMPTPARLVPASPPKKVEKTARIDLASFGLTKMHGSPWEINLRSIAALDTNHMLVPIHAGLTERDRRPSRGHGVYLVATIDGGVTWKGIDGGENPTLVLRDGHIPGDSTAIGGDVIFFSDFGCSSALGGNGWSYPLDKGFCRRTVFTGEGWWLSPHYFKGTHGRHCISWNRHHALQLPSGRIWCAWLQAGQLSQYARHEDETHVKYSDDGGRTWYSWREQSKSARLPFHVRGRPFLVSHGEHVALVWREGWSVFDGEKWSAVKKGPPDSPIVSVVGFGRDEILVATTRKGIVHWNGTEWRRELEAGEGKLAVCGNKVLAFFTRDKELICRQRRAGEWSQPQTIITEETPIAESTLQPYAPDDFVPLAYTTFQTEDTGKNRSAPLKPWIQVVKVPAL